MTRDDLPPAVQLEGLVELLQGHARRASDGQLVFDATAGALAAAGALLWRPWAWPMLASVALAVSAFGAWGIADRELAERVTSPGPVPPLLRAGRAVAAAVGWLSLVAAAFSLVSLAIGRWIS